MQDNVQVLCAWPLQPGRKEVPMSDRQTNFRPWGALWQQLQAEIALIEAAYPDTGDFDNQFEKMLEIDRARQAFRQRVHQPEPPHWE